MDKTNIIVLTSDEGTMLQSILDNCKIANVVGVVSDKPKVGGILKAQAAKILHICVVDKQHNETIEHHSTRLVQCINIITQMNDNVSLIVLAGFATILTPEFITYFKSKGIDIINIHPSLLLENRGPSTHKQVLQSEDDEHGITIHSVATELHNNSIIFQTSFYVTDGDNEKSLEKTINMLGYTHYPTVIDLFLSGCTKIY